MTVEMIRRRIQEIEEEIAWIRAARGCGSGCASLGNDGLGGWQRCRDVGGAAHGGP